MRLILLILWFYFEAVLIGRAADQFGGLITLSLLLGAALLGIAWIQREGLQTLIVLRTAMDRGQPQNQELLAGALGFVAGLLLVLPGFLSDLLALALLPRTVRLRLAGRWAAVVELRRPGSHNGVIIEGEFENVDSAKPIHRPPLNHGPD